MIIRPLQGIRVLDLTLLPPGGYCTLQLADLGAEIIRVESPAQAGKPSLVIGQVGLSRGKQSITLDQRHPKANEVLARLAAASDVLIENAKPGSMDARGFGYSQAKVSCPRLIWCSITGFGQDGPYADRAGHDLSYLGHSGLWGQLAPALDWHPGAMISVPVGAMMAVSGVLAALLERSRTGKGCQIDISLAEASTWLLSANATAFTDKPMTIPVTPDRRLYKCADGKFISVAAAEPKTWAALCGGLDLPDLAEVRPYGEAADQITARLAAIFETRPAAEWVSRLGPLGAAVNAVHQGRDILEDPQYKARGTMVKVAGADVPANPIRLLDSDGQRSDTAVSPPVKVGEQTDAVLSKAGFSAEEIGALRAEKVI